MLGRGHDVAAHIGGLVEVAHAERIGEAERLAQLPIFERGRRVQEESGGFLHGGFLLELEARERAYVFDRLTIVDDHDKEIARFGGEVFRRALLGRFFSIPRGDLARNGHAVFEREMDAPTDVGIPAKSQPQGEGDGVELLCIRRFCG